MDSKYTDRRFNNQTLSYYVSKFNKEFLIEMAIKREQLKREYNEKYKDL